MTTTSSNKLTTGVHAFHVANCSLPDKMLPKRCSRRGSRCRRRRATPTVLLLALHLDARSAGAASALALGGFPAGHVCIGGRRGGGGAPPPASFALSPPGASGIDAELLALAWQHRAKVPGSDNHRQAYSAFAEAALASVRSGLVPRLPVQADRGATEDLTFRLGMAADVGAMPSFAHPGARAGYALGYFCRAKLLADVLFDAQTTPDAGLSADRSDPNFLGECVRDLLVAGHRDVVRVGSLGGGPGFDFVAAAVLACHAALERQVRAAGMSNSGETNLSARPPMTIEATVFDYEEGWSDIIPSMEDAVRDSLGAGHALGFGQCDITLPLAHDDNAACWAAASKTDLWICSYCVAENAALLRSGSYAFFRQLFAAAPPGTLFVFTETTHRLWPEIVDVALSSGGKVDADLDEAAGFDVAFPRSTRGRGKAGFQLTLRKRSGARLGAGERALCARFRQDSARQEDKIRGGWRRQRRKVRGGKADAAK